MCSPDAYGDTGLLQPVGFANLAGQTQKPLRALAFRGLM